MIMFLVENVYIFGQNGKCFGRKCLYFWLKSMVLHLIEHGYMFSRKWLYFWIKDLGVYFGQNVYFLVEIVYSFGRKWLYFWSVKFMCQLIIEQKM